MIFSASRLKPWGTAHIQRGALAGLVGLIWAATGLGVTHRVVTGSPAGLFAVGAIALLTVLAGLAARSPRAGAALSAAALVPIAAALALAVPGSFGAAQVTLAAAGVTAWSLISLILPRRESDSVISFFTATTVLGAGVLLAAGAEIAMAAAAAEPGLRPDRGGVAGHRRSSATVRAVGAIPAAGHPGARGPHAVGAVVAGARGPAATGPDQRRAPDRIHRGRRTAQRDRLGGDRVAAGNNVRLGLVRGRRDRGRGCAAGPGVGLGRHAKPGCWLSRTWSAVALVVLYTATAHYLAALVIAVVLAALVSAWVVVALSPAIASPDTYSLPLRRLVGFVASGIDASLIPVIAYLVGLFAWVLNR